MLYPRVAEVSKGELQASQIGVMLVVAGIRLGGKARRRVSERVFRKAVLILLAALDLGLILRVVA